MGLVTLRSNLLKLEYHLSRLSQIFFSSECALRVVMTAMEMEPDVDELINFKGASIPHVKPQSNSIANTSYNMVSSGRNINDEYHLIRTEWNSITRKEMAVSVGYQNIAVLIIKWGPELDTLKTAEEVSMREKPSENDGAHLMAGEGA